jgi:hypothetical protein
LLYSVFSSSLWLIVPPSRSIGKSMAQSNVLKLMRKGRMNIGDISQMPKWNSWRQTVSANLFRHFVENNT